MSATPASVKISNPSACERWIKSLNIDDELAAHQALVEQIDALSNCELTALERLRILETLKETVDLLQAVVAKRYTGKAQPLDKADADTWQSVVMLWWALSTNYRCCLDAYAEGDTAITQFGPLANLRCLQMMKNMLLDYYRAYRQPPPAIWQDFNELLGIAAKRKVAHIRVQDAFVRKDPDCSCLETYVQGLLIHLTNPYSLTVRQFGFVWRWVQKWAPLTTLSSRPPAEDPAALLVIEFVEGGPRPLAANAPRPPGVLYLDLGRLSTEMRQTIALLKKGSTPAQLGLGADARQPGCEALLMLLYVRLFRPEQAREDPRSPADEPGTVCFGIADAHGLISSLAARVSSEPAVPEKRKQEMDSLALYFMKMRQTFTYKAESWRILNQSATGFMCLLREPSSAMRIQHNQLIAIQRKDSTSCRIGVVQWLKISENNEFQCGIRLFPGEPQAIMVKPQNFKMADRQVYEPALLLPEVTAPARPATVSLPAGWFQEGRVIEIKDSQEKQAKLISLVESNVDFERCTFVYTDAR